MVQVILYVRAGCKDCEEAEQFLKERGARVSKVAVSGDHVSIIPLGTTLPRDEHPVVIIGGRRVGNFDEVKRLDACGMLKSVLRPKSREV
jgi:glutaredoxin